MCGPHSQREVFLKITHTHWKRNYPFTPVSNLGTSGVSFSPSTPILTCSIPLEADLYSCTNWILLHPGGSGTQEALEDERDWRKRLDSPLSSVSLNCRLVVAVFFYWSLQLVWWPRLVTAALDGSGNRFYHLFLQSVTAKFSPTPPHTAPPPLVAISEPACKAACKAASSFKSL